MTMSPREPYLLRAVYQWILDNGCTPYLLVDANHAGVRVPPEHVKDGKIVLNIAPQAVSDLELGDDRVHFSARFGGVPEFLQVPVRAVVAIYARENSQGLMFDHPEPEEPEPEPPGSGPNGPKLRVVK